MLEIKARVLERDTLPLFLRVLGVALELEMVPGGL